jgi:CheY-like chemotaxis protein
MPVVRLVCWNAELAQSRAELLEASGLEVDASPLNPAGLIGTFKANLPAVVVIDLDRLPSQGLGVAVALRNSKATRHIPIVFAGGVQDKVDKIRRELPDVCYTAWARARATVKQALRREPVNPVQPTPHMERYTGSSLAKKLGLKTGVQVALLGAPDGFPETLGDLPAGVELQSKLTKNTNLMLWFVRSRHELECEAEFVSARLPEGSSVWIIHPKQSSRCKADFNQNDVRNAGLAVGLVDYKVCSVDADWSGLKFARRKLEKA